jgi:putative membrane protein
MFHAPTVLVLLAATGLTWLYGGIGLLLLALVPLLIVRARAHARYGGYAETGHAVVVRTGWLSRNWGLVEIDKLQSIRLTQSPLDRRHGMATIWFDTAGAGAAEGVLRVSHLAVGTARQLYDRLASTLDRQPKPGRAGDSAVESAPWPEGST